MSRRGKLSDGDVSQLKILFPETPAGVQAPGVALGTVLEAVSGGGPGGAAAAGAAAGNAATEAAETPYTGIKRLAITSSGLNNTQISPLTVILANSRLDFLNLSNNEVDDLSDLSKLFAAVDGRCSLKGVDLSRNFIRENGAA